MPKPSLDELLHRSAPLDVTHGAKREELIRRAIHRARPRSRRLSRALFFPIAGLAALGLTAGAAVAADNVLTLDVVIPITYVTDTGKTFSCEAQVGGGSHFEAGSTAAADWYRAHDWTGVGQRIYDLALTLEPADWFTDGATPTQQELDSAAWGEATTRELLYPTPRDLEGDWTFDAAQWDCTGVLH